jgi:selenide,water dikinase
VLILTKPLGSGTILAAAMAGAARGGDVMACFDVMVQEQGTAAAILSAAHAMTDVTGFGLAGHLAGICEASGLAAEVTLAEVPLMPGALDLAEAGTRSTLWTDNRGGAGPVFGAEGARGALLFDPQTCGGLLAALPEEGAEAAVSALRKAGYTAVRIGRLVAGDPSIRCH